MKATWTNISPLTAAQCDSVLFGSSGNLPWESSASYLTLFRKKNARLLKHHDQHIIFLGHQKFDLTPTSVSSILWEQNSAFLFLWSAVTSLNVLLCECCKCFAGVGKKYCYCRNVEGFLFGAKCHFHQTTYWSSTRCIKTRRGEWCERTREEEAMLFL